MREAQGSEVGSLECASHVVEQSSQLLGLRWNRQTTRKRAFEPGMWERWAIGLQQPPISFSGGDEDGTPNR
jgi:hypothetical protein